MSALTVAWFGPELDWQRDGLCGQVDPELWFPEKGGTTRAAKKVCAGCDVRSECLEYALANNERFGIWGGLSERERRKLRAERGYTDDDEDDTTDDVEDDLVLLAS